MKKLNWKEFNRGVFVVVCLAIIIDKKTKKILIGRRENDKYIKQLTWCFPGGRPRYSHELEFYLASEVKKKTNLKIKIKDVIFAKTYPENRQFLSIYCLVEKQSGQEKAGESFVELKWVKPNELKKHFTTSLHPELYRKIVKLIRVL